MSETELKIDPEYRPKWHNRRLTIFGSLIFSALSLAACIIGWLVFGLEINAPLSAVLCALIAMCTVVISVYVFNARIEDIDIARMISR